MEKLYYIYILASKRNGTSYTGMTSDLAKRIYQHKNGLIKGFTKKYSVKILVHVETYINIHDAILREKRIKKWKRQWKINLKDEHNPNWRDLYRELIVFK